MTIEADGSRFSATDDALEPERPRLQLGSVVSLLFALIAVGSLWSLTWLVAALVAIALSLVSLAVLHQSQGRYYGRAYASAALCLSVFFIALGLTYQFYSERLTVRRSEQVAQQWLELVRAGKLEIAHHLTLVKAHRLDSSASLEDYYADSEHAGTFIHFQNQIEIKALRGAVDATISLESSKQTQHLGNFQQITHRYRVTFPDQPGSQLDLTVVTERSREFMGPWRWRIFSSSGKWHKLL